MGIATHTNISVRALEWLREEAKRASKEMGRRVSHSEVFDDLIEGEMRRRRET